MATLARYQFTVVDGAGNVVPGASVTVRQEVGGSPLASLFSDRDGLVAIGNPVTADADGYVYFHVVGGAYKITATSGAFTREWRYVGISLWSETEPDQDLLLIANLATTAYGRALLELAGAAGLTALLNAFVGDSGAGGTKGAVPAPAAGDASAGKFLKADGTFAVPVVASGAASGLRLTLQSGVAVMTTTQSAKTTVYATPYTSQFVPLYDGTSISSVDFGGEVSQATTDTTKSPAAGVANTCYDVFGWDDGGTKRATRGPKWSKTATITVTIATPGVVTWTAHGLLDGMTVSFTTSGALPTGITAGTDYFITKVDANSFKLSTTLANQVAGTFVATSGTQSGTHTGENRTTSRGTGAGTSDLVQVKGVQLNANSITNGAAAQRGTYLGTIFLNGSAQVDWIPAPAAAAGGGVCELGVWNMYNRQEVFGLNADSTDTWSYTTTAWRQANAAANMRINAVFGLDLEASLAIYNGVGSGTSGQPMTGVALDSITTFSGSPGAISCDSANFGENTAPATYMGYAGIGRHYFAATEFGGGSGAFKGDNGTPTSMQSALFLKTRM